MELENKTVVITGGSRGIGKSIAEIFAKEGCNLVLNARSEIDPNYIKKLEQYGHSCLTVLGDISSEETAQKILDTAVNHFGQIDILINNAGITKDKLMIAMTPEDFTKVVDVNLVGTFNITNVIFKKMIRKKSGCIINLASVIGQHGNIGQANYAASKAGVIALTQSIAKEGAMRNIRCNAIAPGMIETDMTNALADKVKDEILNQIPLKRFGKAEEVAQAALFLAKNDYVTGQVITVDGGMTI